jgi:hypothetical protein
MRPVMSEPHDRFFSEINWKKLSVTVSENNFCVTDSENNFVIKLHLDTRHPEHASHWLHFHAECPCA